MPLIEAKYYEKAASADRLMLILTVFLGLFSLVVLGICRDPLQDVPQG